MRIEMNNRSLIRLNAVLEEATQAVCVLIVWVEHKFVEIFDEYSTGERETAAKTMILTALAPYTVVTSTNTRASGKLKRLSLRTPPQLEVITTFSALLLNSSL